jgi:hypothetical protein
LRSGSGRQLDELARKPAEIVLMKIGRRQRSLNARCQLDDAGGNLNEGEAQGVELDITPERGFRRQTAQDVQQPVGDPTPVRPFQPSTVPVPPSADLAGGAD